MSESQTARPSWRFWGIATAALLWNAFGALDYVMTQTRNETYLAGFNPEQLEYFLSFPAWAVATWATAVWSSVAGAVLLLLRKRLATWAFLIALVALLATSAYNLVLSEGAGLMGGVDFGITIAVWVIAIALLLYSRALERRGVLV